MRSACAPALRPARFVTPFILTALALAAALTAAAQPASDSGLLTPPVVNAIHGEGWPALSPDGQTLAFVYLGDIWTVPISGGTANRLTVHEALDAYPRWSPDGRWIAFTSTRTGNADIFLVPSDGGAARQVTYNSSNDWVNDWSPDGNKLLFYSIRDTRAFSLFTIDLRTRAVKRLTDDYEPLRFASWSAHGGRIAYTRAGEPWWRPWYRGSIAATTIVMDVNTGKVHTLIKTPTQQFWPQCAPDGRSVFVDMIYGSGNTPNIWRVPVDGGAPKQITHYSTDAVRQPCLARNGSLLTYLWSGDIYTCKPDGSKPAKVTIYAHSDDKVNNQEIVRLTAGATEARISPDGKQMAVVLRGTIWLVPVAGGDAKRLTEGPVDDRDISWSPDGSKLCMVSDRNNQTDLWTVDVKTKELKQLTNDPASESHPLWSPDGATIAYAKAGANAGLYLVPAAGGPERRLAEGNGNNNFGIGITSHGWAPDSRWLAFSRMDRSGNIDIWIIAAAGGKAIDVTRYPGENGDPKFTRDGRTLLFVSDREGPPGLFSLALFPEDESQDDDKRTPPDRGKDVKIEFDDIHLRAKQLLLPGPVEGFAPAPDSQKVIVHVPTGFWSIPIGGGPATLLSPLGEQGSGLHFASDGARFFYLGTNGTPRSIALAGSPPSAIAFSAEMVFDRRAQYLQAFNEFYRRFGAGFYDPRMHGVDWKALRAKYETFLEGVGTPEEFANLLSEMVGEVNSSHSEIQPASKGGGPQTATLGLFYDDGYAGPGLKVTGVMPKGPADKRSSRVNPGEYIMSVDGTQVRMTEDYYLTLQDKAGKTVELMVNGKPTMEGARLVKVKPIATMEWMDLEYQARVRRKRELVDQLSGNRLAYIHIRSMDPASEKDFERELWSDAEGKDGLILDIRGNPGGNTHDAILAALSRRVYMFTQPRDGLRESQPEQAWTKPIVLLIDQNSDSDAEIFPAGFRALHLGKIVGMTTPGYVIGTYEGRLVDGTRFRIPSWGYYTADGKNLENLGIAPDITVENTAEDIAEHRDRQLQIAVETLMKEAPPSNATARASSTTFRSATENPNGASSAVSPKK